MFVRDLLRQKAGGVVTIEAGKTIDDAIELLNEHRIGALIVTGEDGDVCGIISERDILQECGRRSGQRTAAAPPIRNVMTTELVIGVPDDDLNYVMNVMTTNRIRHLPILDDGTLVGIVSIGDVVKALVDESEFEIRMLRNYIQGAGT